MFRCVRLATGRHIRQRDRRTYYSGRLFNSSHLISAALIVVILCSEGHEFFSVNWIIRISQSKRIVQKTCSFIPHVRNEWNFFFTFVLMLPLLQLLHLLLLLFQSKTLITAAIYKREWQYCMFTHWLIHEREIATRSPNERITMQQNKQALCILG